jgi:ADP-ribose pyrophosphatase YjhB (NUDIX family)
VNQSIPDQPPIAAAIIVRDGKVLLVRRRVREGTLSWQFPAGAIEADETPGQAAIREPTKKPDSPSPNPRCSANASTPTLAAP